MDIKSLKAIGLTKLQAEAYALLIEKGSIKPPEAAKALKTSRTNAYKLLDKLVELGLVEKKEKRKTFTYSPASPLSLADLGAQRRAEAVAQEEAINMIMPNLLNRYYKHASEVVTQTATGRLEVAEAYRKQINLHEDIFFIHTPADVPMMGFDTMHEIRVAPSRNDNQRKGILTAPDKGPINHKQHARSNLEITWAEKSAYSAPVEWSVTESSLLIVTYAEEPRAVLIVDTVVAAAFLQLWHLLNCLLQQQETHKKIQSRN